MIICFVTFVVSCNESGMGPLLLFCRQSFESIFGRKHLVEGRDKSRRRIGLWMNQSRMDCTVSCSLLHAARRQGAHEQNLPKAEASWPRWLWQNDRHHFTINVQRSSRTCESSPGYQRLPLEEFLTQATQHLLWTDQTRTKHHSIHLHKNEAPSTWHPKIRRHDLPSRVLSVCFWGDQLVTGCLWDGSSADHRCLCVSRSWADRMRAFDFITDLIHKNAPRNEQSRKQGMW